MAQAGDSLVLHNWSGASHPVGDALVLYVSEPGASSVTGVGLAHTPALRISGSGVSTTAVTGVANVTLPTLHAHGTGAMHIPLPSLRVPMRARWRSATRADADMRATVGVATSADVPLRSAWVPSRTSQRDQLGAWGRAVKTDRAQDGVWGGPMLAAQRDQVGQWFSAVPQDRGHTPLWGGPMHDLQCPHAAQWVAAVATDRTQDGMWSGPMLVAQRVLHAAAAGARRADRIVVVVCTKAVQLAGGGIGVINPPTPESPPHQTLYIHPARYYMTLHSVTAIRLADGEPIPLFDCTISADSGGFCWQLSANTHPSAVDILSDEDLMQVTIDGLPWVFVCDAPSTSEAFGRRTATLTGRSQTAYLGAPWASVSTRSNNSPATAQQLAAAALLNTGYDLDWGITDWLIPAGSWSHQGTPLQAVIAVAEAAGGYILSHPSAAILQVRHPYPELPGGVPGGPWNWDAASQVDVELAPDAIITSDVRRTTGPAINGIYVSGTTAGVLALVKRSGTAADQLANMIAAPLITAVEAAQQRGLSVLGTAGRKRMTTLSLPVLTGPGQPGVLQVGQLVQVNTTQPWRGRVRSVSLSAKMPSVRQSVVIERHLEATP